jgi:hypothetical protein
VGAAAVVIHERPVVLQAPVIGRPFVKEVPHFLKTVVSQQSSRSCPGGASQLQRLDETVKPVTDQTFQPTKATPVRRVTAADQKSGTLQLGEFCYGDLQSHSVHGNVWASALAKMHIFLHFFCCRSSLVQ